MVLPPEITEVAHDLIEKTVVAQKYQKLFHRGVLTWDEVAEQFAERQLGDPEQYIGTREQYENAIREMEREEVR